MEGTLASWKEIADYLGKSVRTVQRWEVVIALPVHRPSSSHHLVLAYPSELSDWITGPHARPHANGDLRKESATLRARSSELREEVRANVRRLQRTVHTSAELCGADTLLAIAGFRHIRPKG